MQELLESEDNEFQARAPLHYPPVDAVSELIEGELLKLLLQDVAQGIAPHLAARACTLTSMETMFWLGYHMAKDGEVFEHCECESEPVPHNPHLN